MSRPDERPLYWAPAPLAGARGYCPLAALHAAVLERRAVRAWMVNGQVVSCEMPGRGIWKAQERLPLPTDRAPVDALAELHRDGHGHPSSWAAAFWRLAPSWAAPRVAHTVNGLLSWWPGGPWSEARRIGRLAGRWYRYDLVSAYRWAAELGLPDVDTFEASSRDHTGPAIWVGETVEARPDLPSPFQTAGARVVVPSVERDAYQLRLRIIRGIRWRREGSAAWIGRVLGQLPSWARKAAARAFWGRWIVRDPLVCWTPSREWPLWNRWANFVWGWLVVGRVRLRLWQEGGPDAAHVYVDEMLTRRPVTTGTAPGAWHLKGVYPDGVVVRRTGWYGPDGGAPAMQTGVSRTTRPARVTHNG